MATILAEGKHLSKTFPVKGQGKGAALHAVSGVDLARLRGGDPGPGGGVRLRKKHLRPAPAGAAAPHPRAGVL